jgi:resuscitation-promoting factor RpfB
MKLSRGLAVVFTFFLFACQPTLLPTVTIIDKDKIITLQTDQRVPSTIINRAGISLKPNDRVLSNGLPVVLNQPITNSPITLQIRRAIPLTTISTNGQQQIQTSAFTVGEALAEASIWLRAGDKIDPGSQTPISGLQAPVTINLSRRINITSDGKVLQTYSSAFTVGEVLAEAGIPLLGLDTSFPTANEGVPSDGQIQVVRVSESILLTQKPIPFESELVASADVPLDQTQILQPGENGLTVQRIRIRYEDGKEVSRTAENETMVRPPKTRVLGYGTKVEVQTAVVDGVQIEYWRALQMYATAYSPCRSGGDRCYSGTSSGKKLAKGMVGLRYSWYLAMSGQPLYIPGYGFATVEDVCGGCVGKPWIDLGYSDEDYQQWSSWVTVYFLTPVPANVIYVLE